MLGGHDDSDKDIDVQYHSDDIMPSSPDETLQNTQDNSLKISHKRQSRRFRLDFHSSDRLFYPSKCIRKSWYLILSIALVIFLVTCYDRILVYCSLTSGINFLYTREVGGKKIPSISFCSANPLNTTTLKLKGWLSPDKNGIYQLKTSISSYEVFSGAGFAFDDFVLSFSNGMKSCTEKDFKKLLTTDGLCYTYIGEEPVKMSAYLKVGVSTDLSTSHPGIIVRVHDTGTGGDPYSTRSRVFVPRESSAELSIHMKTVKAITPCGESRDGCLMEQKLSALKQICSCLPYWMPRRPIESYPYCSLHKYKICARDVVDDVEKFVKRNNLCADLNCGGTTFTNTLSFFRQSSNPENIPEMQRYRRSSRDLEKNLEEVKSAINALRSTVEDILEVFARRLLILKPKVDFHLRVALGGAKLLLERDFTHPWIQIEDRVLKPLTMESFEVRNRVKFSLEILKTRPNNGEEKYDVEREIAFQIADGILDSKLSLATRAIDNITEAHTGYLNARPLSDLAVTPNKRYDAALIPYKLLTKYPDKQTKFYNGMSEHLTGYIQDVLVLRNTLKHTKEHRDYDVIDFAEINLKFEKDVQGIVNNRNLFRDMIVMEADHTMRERLDNFRKLNRTMIQAFSVLKSVFTNLLKEVEFAKRTRGQSNSSFNLHLIGSIENKLATLRQNSIKILPSLQTMVNSELKVWTSMVEESSLRNFYFELSKDVTAMLNNDSHVDFYRNLFVHEQMLDLEGVTDLKNISNRLNADISSLDLSRLKRSMENVKSSSVKKFNAAVDRVRLNFENCYEIQTKQKSSYLPNKQKTYVENRQSETSFISLTIDFTSIVHEHYEEVSSFSFIALMADIGGLSCLFLGASCITVLQLFDLLCALLVNVNSGPRDTRGQVTSAIE